MSGHETKQDLTPAPVPRSDQQATTATQWEPEDLIEAEKAQRAQIAHEDAVLDELLPRRSATAQREVPRTSEDAINPRKDRQLAGPEVLRRPLSSRVKKSYSSAKQQVLKGMSKTRYRRVQQMVSDRERFNDVNTALNLTVGRRSELPENLRRYVDSMDRSISTYEDSNDRTHIVFSTLEAPFDHGSSRAAVRRRLDEMIDTGEGRLEFDGYIPATHDLSQVPDSHEVVLEIRTRAGMYLGKSDSLPDANHLIGRGHALRPVAKHEVQYQRPDGTRGRRTVYQMEDDPR